MVRSRRDPTGSRRLRFSLRCSACWRLDHAIDGPPIRHELKLCVSRFLLELDEVPMSTPAKPVEERVQVAAEKRVLQLWQRLGNLPDVEHIEDDDDQQTPPW